MAPGEGVKWFEVDVPAGTRSLRLVLKLFGDIRCTAVGDGIWKNLYPDRPAAPWKDGQAQHPAWIPVSPGGGSVIPDSDPVNDGPG